MQKTQPASSAVSIDYPSCQQLSFFETAEHETTNPIEMPQTNPQRHNTWMKTLRTGMLTPRHLLPQTQCQSQSQSQSQSQPHESSSSPYLPTWCGGEDQTPSKKKSQTWSVDEIAFLKDKHRQGWKSWELSLFLGKDGKSVKKTLKKLSLSVDPSPEWIPEWAKTGSKRGRKPSDLDLHGESGLTSRWSNKKEEHLRYYWNLEVLSSLDISRLLGMTHKSVLAKVSSLELPSKAPYPYEGWGGISWEFEADTPSDPKSLDATTQRLVAESSATRFALLYEILHEDNTLSSIEERKIQRELDAILNLHTRIFSKYIGVRSRKYSYQGSATWIIQGELEQAGRTAIFECLRRWHPNRNIRFSRGAIGIAINREMIALVEQQRLVELPDKIRSVARKLKRAQEHGNLDSEVKRLTEEAGANCVKEASKHQNTYAFLSTVPIMDAYDETAAEQGAIPSGILHCMEDFSCHTPSSECTDVRELILNSAAKLTPEEKRALLAYHGIAEDGAHVAPKILEEIGAEEGVTKERIRQRIQKGKIKMRRYLEQKNIKSVHDAMMHR